MFVRPPLSIRALSLLGLLCLVAACVGCDGSPESSEDSGDAADAADLLDASESGDAEDVGDADRGDSHDTVDGDTSRDDPDNCQINCEVKYSCVDGTVYDHPWRMSCSGGQQACNAQSNITEVHQCQDGCALYENYWSWPIVEQPSEMCEENRPRGVGESCQEDADCEPSDRESGRLECDPESNTCIDPSVPDYLEYCEIPADELASGEGFVSAPTDGFPGCGESTYCVVDKDANRVCQSCSLACETAADCPSGSTCQSVSGLGGSGDGDVRLCVPKGAPLYRDYVECRTAN